MRTLISIVAAGVIVFATPAIAVADSAVDGDSRADVYLYDWESDEVIYDAWPHDISRVRIRHTTRSVIVRVNFHSLRSSFIDAFHVNLNKDSDRAPEFHMVLYPGEGDGLYPRRWGTRRLCDIRTRLSGTVG